MAGLGGLPWEQPRQSERKEEGKEEATAACLLRVVACLDSPAGKKAVVQEAAAEPNTSTILHFLVASVSTLVVPETWWHINII